MKTFKFRVIAFNETENWDIKHSPLKDFVDTTKPIYGTYLYRVGEATYCASMSPSSWCVFIQNYIPLKIDLDKLPGLIQDEVFEAEHNSGGEEGIYVRYLNPRKRRFQSPTITIKAETADEAWEEALEYVRENQQHINNLAL